MEEIQVVATLQMADGNESVGTMWMETAVFGVSSSLFAVLKWAEATKGRRLLENALVENFRGDLTLTIAQTPVVERMP